MTSNLGGIWLVVLLVLCCLVAIVSAAPNVSAITEETCEPAKPCKPGLLLPVWTPVTGITGYERAFRGAVYLIVLFYLFAGVSIVADRFMGAIEIITSQEREITLRRVTGEPYTILVRIWNETVSNLTLMALGSSAPEILLSVIEIFANNFEAGDLGPSTIVGSAAFNLFVIIGICVMVIPPDQKRRIHRNDVFWVTVVWSTFAYIWLYLILCVFSPNVVEPWEAITTFVFFFITVLNAYIANRFFPSMGRRFMARNVTRFTRSQTATGSGTHPDNIRLESADKEDGVDFLLEAQNKEITEFEEHKKLFWDVFTQTRKEHPDLNIKDIGKLTAWKALAVEPKSRAIRRSQAIRALTGSKPIFSDFGLHADDVVTPLVPESESRVTVEFKPCHYICLENIGKITVKVSVDRGSIQDDVVVTVRYRTVEGTAKDGEDFEGVEGLLVFQPREQTLSIPIKIVDSDRYEPDETFEVHLSHVTATDAANPSKTFPASLGVASVATVIIVDDDHAGAFSFNSEVFKIAEDVGTFSLRVNRTRGARGTVSLPYTITEGRAKVGKDVIAPTEGVLIFQNNVTTQDIPIKIINDDQYEKAEDFYVELGLPKWHEKDQEGQDGADGRPILGQHVRAKIIITEDQVFKHFVDHLVATANSSILIGTSSWKQQFSDALTVGGPDEGEDLIDGALARPSPPGIREHIVHYIMLPWKLIFSLIPPTEYANGWVCFCVSIFFIGVVTAIIGDVASHLGCTIGLKDSVTAITLVALGTSLPDTFASKMSAVNDKTADASIGNVTGSNAVNVFLGIGVAWAIAACHHAYNGTVFRVNAGTLASSVALFLFGSLICIGILQIRRAHPMIGAELGGPKATKYITSAIFFLIWALYSLYCTLVAYCILPAF